MYLVLQIGVKGHILFDLQSKEIFLSRDVIFFESIFPYKCFSHTSSTFSSSHTPSFSHELFDFPFIHDFLNPDPPTTQPYTPRPITNHTTHISHTSTISNISINTLSHPPDQIPITHLLVTALDIPFQPRRSSRISHPHEFLQDYHCNLIENAGFSLNSDEFPTSSARKYHLSSFMSYNNLSTPYSQYILNMTSMSEPKSYEEAIKDMSWSRAI